MPAGNKHPCGGNPTVATNRKELNSWRIDLQAISRLVAADGLLLILVVQIQHEGNDARQRANGSKSDQNRRSYCTTSRDLIPASDTRLLPLLAGGQATVFHRILPFKFENWKALGFHSPYNTKLVVTSQRIGLRIIPEKNWYAVKLYLWKDGARQLTNSPVPRLFFFLFFFRIVPFIQNRFHLCN